MKKIFLTVFLFVIFSFMSEFLWADDYNSCKSIGLEAIEIDYIMQDDVICGLSLSLRDAVKGKLFLNNSFDEGGADGILLTRKSNIENVDTIFNPDKNNPFFNNHLIALMSHQAGDQRIDLKTDCIIPYGSWILHLPESFLEIQPDVVEVDSIDIPTEELYTLSVCGAWHKDGSEWNGQSMFSFHDDDGMDGYIPSSSPRGGMKTGYFSILYPVLESLGVRGCVSLEGRRAGWHYGGNNVNARILKRMQDELGWEVQAHSMTCIGEVLNNWYVDHMQAPVVDKLLRSAENYGPENQNSVSVYDGSAGIQYMPLADRSGWVEADSIRIKPYIGDYETKKSIFFNPDYSVNYQWGEWFECAKLNGIEGRCWVAHNTSSSHANVPLINSICPNGFADMGYLLYNLPPLMSTVTRMMLEGQVLPGYKGENDPDNTFNEDHYLFFRNKIDEAAKYGGWIVMGCHAYRPCWKNSLPGALVSEGGDYPDEWVEPLAGVDPLSDPLTPPERLGIKDWSEWYPCPGTRLDMMWQLLKHAKEIGMINVTSSEGFDRIGNKIAIGYYNKGYRIGQDAIGIIGTRKYYPHYVKGANEEESYYNPFINPATDIDVIIPQDNNKGMTQLNREDNIIKIFDINGQRLFSVPDKGIYFEIANGVVHKRVK